MTRLGSADDVDAMDSRGSPYPTKPGAPHPGAMTAFFREELILVEVAPLSRRERNKEGTRRRILDAATRCFAERGFDDATMDEIAIVADVSRGTLFNYFPTKAAILGAVGEQFNLRFIKTVEDLRASGLEVADLILALFVQSAKYLSASPPSVRRVIALSEKWWAEKDGISRLRRIIQVLEDLLKDGKKGGELDPAADPRWLAEVIASAYIGMIHIWCYEKKYRLEERALATGSMFATMMRPRLPKRLKTGRA